MPHWEYTDVKPPETPPCVWCHKADAVRRGRINTRDEYVCTDCGTTFVAVWRTA